jgi:hypothetical protein
MYRLAWAQLPECFEARMKYLAQADKAARTVMMLTERLDQHRGRGQQQIVVKHVAAESLSAGGGIFKPKGRGRAGPPPLGLPTGRQAVRLDLRNESRSDAGQPHARPPA